MTKLVLGCNGRIEHEYELSQKEISIGRKTSNDIHLDNQAVSAQHAKVITILHDSFIEDLGSTNGTIINGEEITRHALKNGDIISIGTYTLTYIDETDMEDQFGTTMIIPPDTQDMLNTENSDAKKQGPMPTLTTGANSADTSGKDSVSAKLQILSGTNRGKELELKKIVTTLGKPDVQVAAITRRPNGYFFIVVDAGKEEKMPQINDAAVGKKAHPLHDGDTIEVAGTKMAFILI